MKLSGALAAVAATLLFSLNLSAAQPPFGDKASVAYAKVLWGFMQNQHLVGKEAIMTRPYKGMPPHGMILELIEVPITFQGHKGQLIVKRNYGGDGLGIEDVINDPAAYLKAVTIMFRREAGYDSENQDWFWVKYDAQGNIMTNPKGAKLAGRVAKGMPTGCIACHSGAEGDDFVFNHDRYQ